jgi:hypothetical protein
MKNVRCFGKIFSSISIEHCNRDINRVAHCNRDINRITNFSSSVKAYLYSGR